MKYKLQKVSLDVSDVNQIQFPALKDRVIEKTGHVITFTLAQVEANTIVLERTLSELVSMLNHEKAVVENVESFHPFVKDFSAEDLFTLWMYKESKEKMDKYDKKIKEIEKQLQEDKEEVEEILKQIPDLKATQVTENG